MDKGMTNQEILEKAIMKAERNGWNNKTRRHSGIDQVWMIDADDSPSMEELIFNHDFAKALWGEDKKLFCIGDCTVFHEIAWKEHLRRMVIADDPIEYLGEHI